MNNIKWIWIGTVVLLLVATVIFTVPFTFHPPGDARVIIEHTYGVYIVPPCFDKVDSTNNLSESTLAQAEAKGFEADPECSAELLKPVKQTLGYKLFEKIGAVSSPWGWR